MRLYDEEPGPRCTAGSHGHVSVKGALRCPACQTTRKPRFKWWWEGTITPEAWAAMQVFSLSQRVLLVAVRDERATPELLWMAARHATERTHGSRDIMKAIAKHESCPADVTSALFDTEEREIHEALAENPSASPEILGRLAMCNDFPVRLSVASHPETPLPVLMELLIEVMVNGDRYDGPIIIAILDHWATPDRVVDAAMSGRHPIQALTGVDPRYRRAMKHLRTQPWWEMKPSSREVKKALAVQAGALDRK